ncbi:MAG TPA: FAD-dependent oxidoreductase [Actinomycetales bacterium]|nr:FAD-dependent oxidoreductase [Actinomycetales bacterium]
MSRRRLVVVGADAAGMSAAHQALRVSRGRGAELEVIAFEKTDHTSYSACGIPYWMAGDVESADAMVARTADEHRSMGVDLRMHHQVMALDLASSKVEVRDLQESRTYTVGFDDLMLATGAEPVLPEWARGVPDALPVKTLDDGYAWHALLDGKPRSALVVGGGYIGVEAAETFARLGIATTLVTRGQEVMSSSFDPHMAALVRNALEQAGVRVVTGVEVSALGTLGAARGNGDDATPAGVRVACAGGTEYEAEVVAVAIGVRPRIRLAVDAGLPVGRRGGLVPDEQQRIQDGVWAAGDCCEVFDRTLRSHWFVPLGTHANKAGRVAGTVIGGGTASFPGIVGTAITRAGRSEVARTGVLRKWLPQMGLNEDDVAAVTLDSTTASGYMPEADPITVCVVGEKGTGRLLSCQIVGGRGAGKRIDIAATAMWAGMRADEVAMLDLAYAPPFSPVWDPVQIACRKLADRL